MIKYTLTNQYTDADDIATDLQANKAIDVERRGDLMIAANSAKHAKRTLVNAMSDLKRRLETVVDELENSASHSSINSQGEVQGSGSKVDVACVMYHAHRDELERYLRKNFAEYVSTE